MCGGACCVSVMYVMSINDINYLDLDWLLNCYSII